jgi:hypothetical protein
LAVPSPLGAAAPAPGAMAVADSTSPASSSKLTRRTRFKKVPRPRRNHDDRERKHPLDTRQQIKRYDHHERAQDACGELVLAREPPDDLRLFETTEM